MLFAAHAVKQMQCADQHLPKRKLPTSLMESALVMTWTPRGNALLADRRAEPKQEAQATISDKQLDVGPSVINSGPRTLLHSSLSQRLKHSQRCRLLLQTDVHQIAVVGRKLSRSRMPFKGELRPLPEFNERLAGESSDTKENYNISVSNADGYLCHLTATCYFRADPEDVYAIFVNPDNTGVFRDIKTSGRREVLEEIPSGKGYRRTVEVEQLGEAKVLMFGTTFSTEVTVLEDDSDPQQLKTHFELKRSDILNRFHGNWLVTPMVSASGQLQGCKAVLNQEVLPRGVPAWLANAPVLGSALRGVVVRSAQRMIEDIEAVLRQVDNTNDIHQVLRRAASKGHAKDAEKQAQAQRKQDRAQEAAERKKSGTGGRFL